MSQEELKAKLLISPKIEVRRVPLNETMFCALLQWSRWRLLNLAEKEQATWLLKGMQAEGYTCEYDDDQKGVIALHKRLDRIFEEHLRLRPVHRRY